jgi:hypothetical protein
MKLQEAMEISESRPELRICREPNYGYHYKPIYFISRKGVLRVVDLDDFENPNYKEGRVAPGILGKLDHDDWMLYGNKEVIK